MKDQLSGGAGRAHSGPLSLVQVSGAVLAGAANKYKCARGLSPCQVRTAGRGRRWEVCR